MALQISKNPYQSRLNVDLYEEITVNLHRAMREPVTVQKVKALLPEVQNQIGQSRLHRVHEDITIEKYLDLIKI